MNRINWLLKAQSIERELVDVFHYFHQYPELSGKEYRTTEYIAEKLKSLPLEIRKFDDYPGLVASLKGPDGGPIIAIRCDMDALPIQEASTSNTPSKVPGVMHACGHDLHMTACIGAAMLLSSHQPLPFGVKFIFQPAEETNAGAKELINRAVLKDPNVDYIIGLHANPELSTGMIGLSSGPMMSAESNFSIEIKGESSHGSQPHVGKDALLAGAAVVVAVQSIVSRRLNPLDTAVISIGTFTAGTARNIIAPVAALTGTVRFFRPELDLIIQQQLRQIVEQTAAAYGCTGQVEYISEQPPVVNEPKIIEDVRSALVSCFSERRVVSCGPCMASEDFSYYLEHKPGVFIWVGTTGEGKAAFPLHNSAFFVAPEAIPCSVAALCMVACAFESDLQKG